MRRGEELEIVKWLRKHSNSNGSNSSDITEFLSKKFHLKVTRHQRFLNLVQLSYSNTACDMSDPMVRECRGIVLDAKKNWEVVCFPYTKFFNYGEPLAADLDWRCVKLMEERKIGR